MDVRTCFRSMILGSIVVFYVSMVYYKLILNTRLSILTFTPETLRGLGISTLVNIMYYERHLSSRRAAFCISLVCLRSTLKISMFDFLLLP